jgi:hypothetical protein
MEMVKKLNNKGYLLVEIIVAFVLAMGVAYFIGEITINLKNKEEDLSYQVGYNTDKALITKEVMDDVNSYEVKNVVVSTSGCNGSCIDITYNDTTGTEVVKRIEFSKSERIFRYGELNSSKNGWKDSNYFEKEFDKTLTLWDLSYNNTTGGGYNFAKIVISATNIYSNKDYGVNLVIPYKSS